MAPVKKGKGGGKSKASKGKESNSKGKDGKRQQDDWQREVQGSPQERVAAVKPFWEGLCQEERVKLLSISIDDLKQRAKEVTERQRKQAAIDAAELAAENPDGGPVTINLEPTMEDILDEGIRRLKEKSTWKLWEWPMGGKEFYDADSFRQCIEQEALDESLRKLLPKDEGKPVERPAEAALRMRMTELLQRVHQNNRQLQDDMGAPKRLGRGHQRATPDQIHNAVRDTNIDMITAILEALEKEHEFLYHAVLFPVTSFVCEMLPDGARESGRTELFFEDLEKLPPDEVARICEWLTEKVDGFGSKTKPEPKDIEEQEEEEGIGDVDLFSLANDDTELTVNAKWLQHLQERLLGEDGHPRKVHEGEDPFKMGLVLEWVYGTIVSTAEKARDGAKRSLGGRPPLAQQAYDQLVQALRDQQNWEARAKSAKDLLNEMLTSRREAANLVDEGYDLRPVPPPEDAAQADLPDKVILPVLKREVLLTRAKLHALCYDHLMGERNLRSLKSQLRQGEPEFDRLKRELEEVKNQPRGLEGTFRTAAEMERHRAQLADQAIEEQLEVQTAFREHGARLQRIYDNRQRTEVEMARREQEMKQLNGWKSTVQALADRYEELLYPSDVEEVGPASLEDEGTLVLRNPAGALGHKAMSLEQLHAHFNKDVRRQLYTLDDDRIFFDWIQRELKAVEKRLEDGRAALQHLEMFLISVACDDPGAAIGAQLALPLLQERLDAHALDFAAQRAMEAEQAIIQMEEEKLQKELAEKEKKQKQKLKLKEKVRTEKERQAAEKEARERAERDQQEEEERARAEQEEAERLRKLEELERVRKQSEEEMEARRIQLIKDDPFYRLRAEQQKKEEELREPKQEDDASDWNMGDSTAGEAGSQHAGDEGFRDGDSRRPRRLRPQPRRMGSGGEHGGSEGGAPERANGFVPRANGRLYPEQPKAVPVQRDGMRPERAVPVMRPDGPPPVGPGPRGPRPPREPPAPKGGPPGLRHYSSAANLPSVQLDREPDARDRPRSAIVKPRAAEPVSVERPASATLTRPRPSAEPRAMVPLATPPAQRLPEPPEPTPGPMAAPVVAQSRPLVTPVAPASAGPGTMQLQFGAVPSMALATVGLAVGVTPSDEATAGPAVSLASASQAQGVPGSPTSAASPREHEMEGTSALGGPVFGNFASLPMVPMPLSVPGPASGGETTEGQAGRGPSTPSAGLPPPGPAAGPHMQPQQGPLHPLPRPQPHLAAQAQRGLPPAMSGPPPMMMSSAPQPSMPSGAAQQHPPMGAAPPQSAPPPSLLRNDASASPSGAGAGADKHSPKQGGSGQGYPPEAGVQGTSVLFRPRPQPRRAPLEPFLGPPAGQIQQGPPFQTMNGMPPPRLANGPGAGPHPLPPSGLPNGMPPSPADHITRAKAGAEAIKPGSMGGLGRGSSPGPTQGHGGPPAMHMGGPGPQGNMMPRGTPVPPTPTQPPVRPPHQHPTALPASPTGPRSAQSLGGGGGPSQLGPGARGQQLMSGRSGGPPQLPQGGPMMMGPGPQGGNNMGPSGPLHHQLASQAHFSAGPGAQIMQMGPGPHGPPLLGQMQPMHHPFNSPSQGGPLPLPVGSPSQHNPGMLMAGQMPGQFFPPGGPQGQLLPPGGPMGGLPHGPQFVNGMPMGPRPFMVPPQQVMGGHPGGPVMVQPPHGMGNSHLGPPHLPHSGNQMAFSPPNVGMMPMQPFFPQGHPGAMSGPGKDGMQPGWMGPGPGGRGMSPQPRQTGKPGPRISSLRYEAREFVPSGASGGAGFGGPRGSRPMPAARLREGLDQLPQAQRDFSQGAPASAELRSPPGPPARSAPYEQHAAFAPPAQPEAGQSTRDAVQQHVPLLQPGQQGSTGSSPSGPPQPGLLPGSRLPEVASNAVPASEPALVASVPVTDAAPALPVSTAQIMPPEEGPLVQIPPARAGPHTPSAAPSPSPSPVPMGAGGDAVEASPSAASQPSPPKSPLPMQQVLPPRESPSASSASPSSGPSPAQPASVSVSVSAPSVVQPAPQQAQQQAAKWSAVAARDTGSGPSSRAGLGRVGSAGSGVPGADYEVSSRQPGAQGRPSGRRNDATSGASARSPAEFAQSSGAMHRVGSAASVSSTASNSSVHTGDKRKVTRAGGVVWEGLEGDIARLKLVRGLSNETGYNNCFLNVVIQSLWHLGSFRQGLLSIQPQALDQSGHPPEDIRVLRALWNIFSAFSRPLEELSQVPEQQEEGPSSSSMGSTDVAANSVKRAKVEGRPGGRPSSGGATSFTVSPTELREALSSLDKAAIQFELSEMHDASEVLSEIFNSLHRAECGTLREGALDPQLPHRVRVRAPGSTIVNGAAQPAPMPELAPTSMVQKLFGLEVQLPTPPEDDDVVVPNKRPKGSGGWQEQTSRSSSQRQQQAAAAAGPQAPPKKLKDPNFVEVQQYMKYFHLVPAQGLRAAFDRMVGVFEEMLQYADTAEGLAKGAVHTLDVTLLRPPPVLTLAVVWDSPHAAQDAINSVVSALKTELNAARVFKGLSPARGAYRLRCIVCYFGHHYQAYTLSEELNQWLLFDDTNIKLVGEWKDVSTSIRNSRHQPSLLFYEHVVA